jgi:Secretion system C-terminal sorting domain
MKQIITIILLFTLGSFAVAQNFSAGPNQTITAGENVQLAGQAQASNIRWFTNGSGTFNNRNILNAIYYPSQADINNGSIKLLLVNRRRPNMRDVMKVTITPACTPLLVTAGADIVECGYGFGAVSLEAGIDNNANGMYWTTSGNGFFEDFTNPNTTYYYDQTDVNYAFIDLIATAYDEPGCPEFSDALSLNLQAAPYLEFPEPVVFTYSDNPILYVSVYRYGYASSGTWTSSGTGTFDDATSDYTAYNASQQDINNGYVSFTFTTNDPDGPCGSTSGSMEGIIYYVPDCPTVSFIPSSDTICGLDEPEEAYFVEANVTGSNYTIDWTSNGQGELLDDSEPNAYYYYSAGDVGYGSVTLTCTVTENFGYCETVYADFNLFLKDPARVDVPNFVDGCGGQPIPLQADVSGTTTTVYWQTSGTFGGDGYFSPNPSYATFYYPTPEESFSGTEFYYSVYTNDPTGPCSAGGDEGFLSISGTGVNAGEDQVVCGYSFGGSIEVNATGNNFNGWSTNGFGYFDDEFNPNTIYNYNETDVNYAFIELYAEGGPSGFCSTVFDTLEVNLQAAPSLEFPNPFVYAYSDNPILYLSVYRYGYASSGTWTSSGTGTFDDATSDYPAYTASAQDINNGYLTFTYTTNDPNGPCGSTSGTMEGYIELVCPSISVDAGEDIVVCGYSYGAVLVSATIDNIGNGMEWTTTGFGYFDDPFSPSTAYYYDQSDVDYAFINLTATVYGGGNCPDVSDDLSLNLQAAPRLEFPDPVVFAYSNNPVLYVSVYRYGYASSGTWTSSGTGVFDDATSDYTAYTASQEDILNGGVSFTFTTNDPNGPCGSTSGGMQGIIFYTPVCATVSILPASDTICGSDFGGVYDISANITGSEFYVQWTTDGDGFFYDETSSSTAYEYTTQDAGFGGVTLTCNVYDAYGYCGPVSASFYLKLNDPARIDLSDFGIDACGDMPVAIDGNISGFASTVYWSTSGTGTFSPNPGPSTNYYPTLQDRINGYVDIFGVTNDPDGPCSAAGDYTYLNFYGPVVDAGADIVECGYPFGGSIPVNAILGNNTFGVTWSTDGFGYFDDETVASTNYNYNETDVNYAFINLTATASNGGGCPDFSEVVTVNLQAAPSLEFPNPVAYATSDNPILYLSVYRYGYASSGTWTSSGTGTFDDATSDYPAYTASAQDIANQYLSFTYTTNDPDGPCGAVSGYMEGYIEYTCPPANIYAGDDIVECGYGYGAVYVSATVDNNGNGMLWSTSGFGYFEDETSASTYYYYDQTDVDYAFITLTATAYNNPGCAEATDDLSLNLQAAPYLEFPEPYVYAYSDNPVLYVSVYRYGYASSGTWTSSGTGYFSDPTADYSAYYASQDDINNGSVYFTFTTNDPAGPCGPTSGTMEGYIYYVATCPTVSFTTQSDAICGYDFGGGYDLNATIAGTDYYTIWSTTGSGYLYDDPNNPSNVYYEYSFGDVGSFGITITCSVYDNAGYCAANAATFSLGIDDPARIDLSDFGYYACGDQALFIDNPISGTATTVYWTTSGTGYFSPNPSSSPQYYPSFQDRFFAGVSITGTTNDPVGVCPLANDFSDIFLTGGVVDAGADIVECGYEFGGSIPLNASLGYNAYGVTWSTSGTGYFDDEFSTSAIYNYDANDVNSAFVNLTATVTGNGCPDYSDVVTVNLQAAPALVFPEPTVYTCIENPIHYVNVYRYGYASSGTWTSSGTGFFDNPASDYAAYYSSQDDVFNGVVYFTFTSNDPDGPCTATSGTMEGYYNYCGGGGGSGDLVQKPTSEVFSEKSIQLFPNPTSNMMRIATNLDVDYTNTYITDLTGKTIACNWEGKNIDVTKLQNGIYFLHVASNGGIEVLKFVKQ